jgi:hypothetical protein
VFQRKRRQPGKQLNKLMFKPSDTIFTDRLRIFRREEYFLEIILFLINFDILLRINYSSVIQKPANIV